MKKIIALMLWLVGSVCYGQSVNGVSPSTVAVDGSNTTAAKVIVWPQVQATIVYNASATPSPIVPQPTQVSNWFPLNGNGSIGVEFASNTFVGSYQVQVSDNPTPVSTPGTNVYTVVADTATNVAGGQGSQTKNWMYFIREGYKWMRLLVTPESTNNGTLNVQARLFGNPPAGDAIRSYVSGVPWKSADQLASSVTQSNGAVTYFYDYKLPQDAHGFNLFTNVSAVSGAATITSTVEVKDPTTGQLQSIALGTAAAATGFSTITVGPGYAAPYPVATPPAGQIYISAAVNQDVVIKNVVQASTSPTPGSITFSQAAVPIR